MTSKLNILAIIPARGGSKGIPKKNVRLLVGQPLIAHTIGAALKSKYITKVLVSTDDSIIAKVSKTAGAEVLKRPKELAQDLSPIQSVLEHTLDYLKKTQDYNPNMVLLLQPTSPLRTTQDIDGALEVFLKNNPDSVISVCQPSHAVHWSFVIKKNQLQPLFDKKHLKQRRQDLPKVYIPNGAIYISTPKHVLKYKTFYGGNVMPYIMPVERSVDIDHEIDFKLTELLIKKSK